MLASYSGRKVLLLRSQNLGCLGDFRPLLIIAFASRKIHSMRKMLMPGIKLPILSAKVPSEISAN